MGNVYKQNDNLDDKIVKMKITKDDDATDIDGDFEPDDEEDDMDAVVKGKLGEIKKEVQEQKDAKAKQQRGKPKAHMGTENIVNFAADKTKAPMSKENIVNFDGDNNKANKRKLRKEEPQEKSKADNLGVREKYMKADNKIDERMEKNAKK